MPVKRAGLTSTTFSVSPGENTFSRRSNESSIAVEYPAVIEEPAEGQTQCGWPMHLMIPKGIPWGYSAQLLVMISDYEKDTPRNAEQVF
jgi:hypothetical protein